MVKSFRILWTTFMIAIAGILFYKTSPGTMAHGVFSIALIITSIVFIIVLILPDTESYP